MFGDRFKRQLLKQKLFTKNRLVIHNEDTFEEIFSLKLNLMNVFVVVTLSSITLIAITTYIIAFTPLREYIPGYASTELKREAMTLAIQSDSLTEKVKNNEFYIANLKKVLTGKLEYAKLNKDSLLASQKIPEDLETSTSEDEQELREMVNQQDKYNVFQTAKPRVSLVLFPPCKGTITQSYSIANKRTGVLIALPKNTPIKSTAPGTVIFADWTPTNGYVVIVRHKEDIISVYKNLAQLTKNEGDFIRTGEALGIAGSQENTQSKTDLYFELWKEGNPINPTQFITFD